MNEARIEWDDATKAKTLEVAYETISDLAEECKLFGDNDMYEAVLDLRIGF